MDFKKIQLTRQNTLTVVYENGAGDTVTVQGANIVHPDMKNAMNQLIPHLALLTEQREASGRNLKQIQKDRITDDGADSVFKRLAVDTVTLSGKGQEVTISGSRILLTGSVIAVASPRVNITDDEQYQYNDDLALAIEAVRYEAKEYVEENKWGMREAKIEFEDPFEGVQPGEVPEAETAPKKKRGRKTKVA